MRDAEIPQEIHSYLQRYDCRRPDSDVVAEAFIRLGVPPQSLVQTFFETYEGPFWSEHLGCELLDVVEEAETIETSTRTCRNSFGFSSSSLVLTRFFVGQVVVLNFESDMLYEVNFQEGVELFVADKLLPRWDSFQNFLQEYFLGKDCAKFSRSVSGRP